MVGYPTPAYIRLRWANLAMRERIIMRGLLNAFMGPTRVYSALSSSDFWISGKSNPFPGGRRRLYCYNVSLRFETGTLTVRKSRRGLSPVVTDERDSHIAM